MKDTEYLALTSQIRVWETRMLDRERRERMIEARSDEEAAKLLAECGYDQPEDLSAPAVNAVLAKGRADLFKALEKACPQPALVEVFQIRYDYHNAKALLKAEAMGEDPRRLLMAGGRFEPKALSDALPRGLEGYPEPFRRAAEEAQAVLTRDRDPRRADLILDRACYAEMAEAARRSESGFLRGYVRLSVDAVNLRAAARLLRMGADAALLRESLLPGGNVDAASIAATRPEDLPRRFAGALERAAQLGAAAAVPGGGSLTAFERACDDALTAYLSQAKRVAFGAEPVAAYVAAREAEATAARTILSGRRAGLSGEAIRERLRECYV